MARWSNPISVKLSVNAICTRGENNVIFSGKKLLSAEAGGQQAMWEVQEFYFGRATVVAESQHKIEYVKAAEGICTFLKSDVPIGEGPSFAKSLVSVASNWNEPELITLLRSDTIGYQRVGTMIVSWNFRYAFSSDVSNPDFIVVNARPDSTLRNRQRIANSDGILGFASEERVFLYAQDSKLQHVVELGGRIVALEPMPIGNVFWAIVIRENHYDIDIIDDGVSRTCARVPFLLPSEWDVIALFPSASRLAIVLRDHNHILKEHVFLSFEEFKFTKDEISGLKNFVALSEHAAARIDLLKGTTEIWIRATGE